MIGETNWANDSLVSSAMRFFTVNSNTFAERMRLTSDGKLGIGTSSPQALFTISSGSGTKAVWATTRSFTVNRNFELAVDQYNEGQFTITPSTAIGGSTYTTPVVAINASSGTNPGFVGIGTSSPVAKLDVVGQAVFQGSTLSTYRGATIGAVNINNNSADGTVDFTQGLVFTSNSNNLGAWPHAGIVTTGSSGFNGNLVFGTDGGGTSANSITERMRITSAGNVLVGTTSAAIFDTNAGADVSTFYRMQVTGGDGNTNYGVAISNGSGDAGYGIWVVNTAAKRIRIASFQSSATVATAGSEASFASFATMTAGALTEKMRIDSSGNLLVGTTALPQSGVAGVQITTASGTGLIRIGAGATSSTGVLSFNNPNGEVGLVVLSGTSTAYNTSSDYRLKEIDGPIANSGAYIDALKPVQGSWKVDGSRFIGLLAHEVQEVSETTIATGEKDGEKMQAMDYSAPELIANLIAEIQSLRARVAQLEGN
jgi:hypothetical protein